MALFLELAALAEELAGEAGRLKKRGSIEIAVGRVAGAVTGGGVEDAGLFVLYLAGQPFAEADPRKLNAGGALLSRAVKAVSGCSDAALTAAYRRHGDLGAAAAEVWASCDPTSQNRDAGHPLVAGGGGGGVCGDGRGEDDGGAGGAGGGVVAEGEGAGGEVSAEADAGGHADWGEAEFD